MILLDLRNSGLSVYEGLAVEDLLTQRPEGAEAALLIWKGPGAVVMGKNQNPWQEVNLESLQEEGLPLARRISGGGTVYHDPGNLNISWILPRDQYDAGQITGLGTRLLESMGLVPERGVSGGLRVQGKKVSGAAFCYRRHHVLHHGTLLLNADLNRMRKVLSPPRIRLETHAVASVPASVANLLDLLPGTGEDDLLDVLRDLASREFGDLQEQSEFQEKSGLRKQISQLEQPDWIWDQTPAFTLQAESFSFRVRKGMVSDWKQNGEVLEIPPTPFRKGSLPLWAEAMEIPVGEVEEEIRQVGFNMDLF